MHSCGLYDDRYGLSDEVLLDKVAEQNVPAAEKMLAGDEAVRSGSNPSCGRTRKARAKSTNAT